MRLRNALVDTVVTALLAAGNLVIAPSDPGWLAWQPTPWVILPVWLGLRRGIVAGILAGSAVFLLTMAGHAGPGLDPDTLGRFVHQFRGLLFWIVVLGAVSGEVCSRWKRTQNQQIREAATLETRLQSAQSAVRNLRQARDRLARGVEIQDSEMASLDEDLRGLEKVSPSELPRLLLLAAQQHGRISEAALYLCDPADLTLPLCRKAFIGRESTFPSILQLGECDLADAALENCRLVSIPEMEPAPENGSEESPYVIAAPFCTPTGEVAAVLLISKLAPPSSEARLLDTLALIASHGGCLLGGSS